mgnify:CR=1 FL=1
MAGQEPVGVNGHGAGDPPTEHVLVAVIGSGFGGLGAAVRLRREGVTDFVVLERADAVGGTWRDNSYPGCACDVPSHLYSFSFAPCPDWPRTFSGQRHIRAYLEHVVDAYGLREHIRLGHELTRAVWDERRLCWDLYVNGRRAFTADLVVSATGPLSEPRIPWIPGLDDFPGAVFHSAAWDHDYDLRGKRVAVVGTGASAIQIVPSIQPDVARLTLLQRTPPWVLPRADRDTTAAERWLHRRLPVTLRLRRGLLWGLRELQVHAFTKYPNALGPVEWLARRNLARAVRDPALRKRLTPTYRIGCKRILLSNTYYPALTRPNVDVVTSGLVEVRGSTVVAADGSEAEVDAIVFATGFHVTDMPVAERVVGIGGRTLAESWQDGVQALRGATAAGFPNLLMIIGPNTGLGNTSMILMIEAQLNYLADYLRRLDALAGEAARDGTGPHGDGPSASGRPPALVARADAVAAWNRAVQERMKRTVWNTGGCTSWYLDANGRNTTLWPGTTTAFRSATRRVDLAEYDVLLAGAQAGGDTEADGDAGTGAAARKDRGADPRPAATPTAAPARPDRPPEARGRTRRRAGRGPVTSGRYAPPEPARTLTVESRDGTPLHVELHGPDDAPAVLLVHGWTCSTAVWAAQVRALAADHRVIAYDLRGHGRSPVPAAGADGYGTRQLADDLEAVLTGTLRPGQRAVLAGHSMGGMTIIAAARRPAVRDHAAAVLLCSTGSSRLTAESLVVPLRAGRLRTRLSGTLLRLRPPNGPVTLLSRRIVRYVTMGRDASPEMIRACSLIVQDCRRDTWHRWARVLDTLDLDAEVRALDVPTAVLVGSADRLTPPVHARAIAAALPRCVELAELTGPGHMTPVEVPDEVTGRIRALVTDHVPEVADPLPGKGVTSA